MVISMKKILLALLVVAGASALTGCQTLDQRLDECQSHGLDRDVCYQEYQANMRSWQATSATLNAADTQADAIREGNQIKKDHYDHQDYGTKKKKEHKSKLDQFFGD